MAIEDDPGGDPLVRYVVGSLRSGGTTGCGPLVLQVTATGDVTGEASARLPLVVRQLGDIDGNGGAEPGDLSLLINELNGMSPPGIPDAAFDLGCNGGTEPEDVAILINILNGLAVP